MATATQPTAAELKFWKQCYKTPPEFITWVVHEVLPNYGRDRFTLDTCATAWNARCSRFIAPRGHVQVVGQVGTDGLETPWKTGGAAWCNPGFSGLMPWIQKASAEAQKGRVSCVLSHASHASQWAQFAIANATACWLVHPRINFIEDPRYADYLASMGKTPGGNNRDSMLWVFAPHRPAGGCAFIACGKWKG